MEKLGDVCTKLFSIPSFFSGLFVQKYPQVLAPGKSPVPLVTKKGFLEVFKSEMCYLTPEKRVFTILDSENKGHLAIKDFKPLLNTLLDWHAGLEFLKPTPEFQERYVETVSYRIMYELDEMDSGKVKFRHFKKSRFFDAIEMLDIEEDINKVRAFFSYEHFYVLYCRFWELDSDHDFFITKEEFSKYSGHTLSNKTIDRIFDQETRPFRSKRPGLMSYEDFICTFGDGAQ